MFSFGPHHGWCPTCYRIRPYDKFNLSKQGSYARDARCHECMKVNNFKKTEERNSNALLTVGKKLTSTISVPDLREVTGEIVHQMGGIQQLVSRLVAGMNFAEMTDPKLFRDYCQMVLKLIEVENTRRMDSSELGNMSDNDLAFALKRAAFSLLQDDADFRNNVLSEAQEYEFAAIEQVYADPAASDE